jgi:hypothetical protein
MFGSKALGGALSDLREQGVSGAELERASSIALRSVGIVDQSSAQVLAGTTDEERAIMAGVQAEAETLRAAGAAQEALASEKLETAKLGEQKAVEALTMAQENAAKAAERFADSLKMASDAADQREKRASAAESDLNKNIDKQLEDLRNNGSTEEQRIRKQVEERRQARKDDAFFSNLFKPPSLSDPTKEKFNAEEQKALNEAQAETDRQIKFLEDQRRRNTPRNTSSFARGGLIYAKNGFYSTAMSMFKNIFRPKGVDSVPAMVQPGEFIVSKRGVQSGNNLDILKAMNQGMSGVGNLGFDNIGSVLKDGASMLMKPAESIMHAAEQLKNTFANTNIGMNVSPFNVNVNFNGASFLESLTEDIKSKVMTEVVEEMKKMSFDNSGNSIRKKGVL